LAKLSWPVKLAAKGAIVPAITVVEFRAEAL